MDNPGVIHNPPEKYMGYSHSIHRVSTAHPHVIHRFGVALAQWFWYTPIALVLLLRRPCPQSHTPYYDYDYNLLIEGLVLEVWKKEPVA